MHPLIVGIRFHRVGKIYHFDASDCPDILVGDFAVVETTRGRQLGEVVQIIENPSPPPEGVWKPIHHKATPRDLVLRQLWQKKELEAMINCRARLAEMNIPGVKIVAAEYAFDGSRLSFLYSTEAEGKVDLRRLQTAMQRMYPRSRVEMRQLGPRDVAKLLGGMGACGLENRCCSMFLTEFSPISIKMAKEQGISLTPTEITGMCGRLRCCLIYEYENYVEARKNLPKRNKRVVTPQGEGKVIDVYPLKGTVIVELDNGARAEVAQNDLQPWDELEALRRKAQEPCARHEGGECTCGKSAAPQTPGEEVEATYSDAELVVSEPEALSGIEAAPTSADVQEMPPAQKARKKSRKSRRKKFTAPKDQSSHTKSSQPGPQSIRPGKLRPTGKGAAKKRSEPPKPSGASTQK
ncbi:MAG: regulatory iron-sulfur-containing complex subunit RicT [Anaerolineales bacterium]|nr:regulatory iron-sulfur-containing complex subunit RicT [Anaerolineales bacterium]